MKRAEAARRRALAHVLAAPGLGAFATALGVLGLDGAVALCETRDPPDRVAHVWGVLGYRVEQLPTREEIQLIMVGAEVSRRMSIKRKTTAGAADQRTIAALIAGVCDTPHEAQRAFKVLESYGARVEPMTSEVGAI